MPVPDVSSIETGEEYYHAEFRDPDGFSTIRTPDWAADAADSVLEGSKVRTGKVEDGDEWLVESVLVPIDAVDEGDAASAAAEIAAEIEP